MKERINSVVEMGKVPKEIRDHNKGFSEWDCGVTKQNHQSIVKVISLNFLNIHILKPLLFVLAFYYFPSMADNS